MASSSSRSVSTRPWRRWSLALAAVCWLALTGAAQADTIAVTRLDDPAGAGACPTDCSLRQAIAFSATSDTIELGGTSGSPATYTLTQGNALEITHSLTILGAGRTASRIDGSLNRDVMGRPDRILKVTAGPLLISQLTFTGGTDGRDENFTSCSPCTTLNANGGGAIFNAGASITLSAVSFDANTGSPVGGAIANTGTLDMTDVDFRANGAAYGAGLMSSGTVTAERVTFRDAGGGTRGGAVFQRGGTMTLTNSTVSGNGSSSTIGGGVVNRAGTLTLTNVTLTENLRGGLETAQGATTSVQNTILGRGFSDGINGSCVGGGQNSTQGWTTAPAITNDLGNNLADDLTCGNLTAPSQAGIDAKLAPVTDNAGATPTAALLHGSPAIDAGNDATCQPYDQRSVMRAGQGAHCDIGAFEAIKLGPPSVAASSASEVGSFDATLAATINLAGEAGALYFAWGTSPTELIESTALAPMGLIATPTQRTVPVYGLQPSTTYYFQAVADNATGAATGTIEQFTTKPGPPVVSNVELTAVTDTTATLAFSIDPAGDATSYVISINGQTTTPVNIGSATGPQQLTHTLAGLSPGTGYSIDVIATNGGGPAGWDGAPLEFTTKQQLAQVAGSAVTLTDTGNAADCPETASIDWGDGTPADTSGTVTCSDDGHDAFNYTLTAAHTYRAAGYFPIQIEYSTGDQGTAWALISTPAEPTPTPVATIQPTPTATPTATPTPPPPVPTFHETVVVKPVSGTVLVKLKGTSKFVPLTAGMAVPLGSQIDVTKGRITLTSIPKAGGKPETATFYAGIFTISQRGSITELTLSGPRPVCKARAAAAKPKTRKLWGDGKGKFRTRGQYSAATVRGTKWLVEDSCAGTLTRVTSGVVAVEDRVRHKTIIVRAGKRYLARPR